MRIADTLYKEDAFGDPPNLAERALWPSAAAWKATLTIAAHVDPGFALEQCASLPDPEIGAVEQVTIATVLLGQQTETARFSVRREGEDGHYYASGVIIFQAGSRRSTLQRNSRSHLRGVRSRVATNSGAAPANSGKSRSLRFPANSASPAPHLSLCRTASPFSLRVPGLGCRISTFFGRTI